MMLKRFVILSRKAQIYDGFYYSEALAQRSRDVFEANWPGLYWVIESSRTGLPMRGLMSIGDIKAGRILTKYRQQGKGCAANRIGQSTLKPSYQINNMEQ